MSDQLREAFAELIEAEFGGGTDGEPLSHRLTTDAWLAFEKRMRAALRHPGESVRVALLPCPFCGAKADLTAVLVNGEHNWRAGCPLMRCRAEVAYARTEVAAIEVWNRRALPAREGPCASALREIDALASRREAGAIGKAQAIARSALSALPPQEAWRPIETAKKNGRYMLLSTGRSERIWVGAWVVSLAHGRAGWLVDGGAMIEAKFWQPLPAPPQEPTP